MKLSTLLRQKSTQVGCLAVEPVVRDQSFADWGQRRL